MKLWKKNVSLANCCTWKIGGPAEFFFEPESEQELLEALQYCKVHGIALTVIGGGSNLLFPDNGIQGLTLRIGPAFGKITFSDTLLHVEAGAYTPCMARKSMLLGLSGLEHTVGIPGTAGGLAVMNGGSLRHCISENIHTVRAIHRNTLQIREFSADECQFQYRHSLFQQSDWIITALKLRLVPGDRSEIRKAMLKILQDRRKKFPLRSPSCGSTFKSNPALYEKYGPPGKIIEDLGLKSFQVGGAMISPLHANFIVNTGTATARDVLELTEIIIQRVYKATGEFLEPEYQCLPSQKY